MNKQKDFNITSEFDPTQATTEPSNQKTATELHEEVVVPETTVDHVELVDTEISENSSSTTVISSESVINPFKDLITKLNSLVEELHTKGDDYKTVLQQADCDKFTIELREFFTNFNKDYTQAVVQNQELEDAKYTESNFDAFIASLNNFLRTFNEVAEFDLATAGEAIVNLSLRRDHYQEQLSSTKAKHERLLSQQNTVKNYAAEKLVKNSLKPFFQNIDNALKHICKEENPEFQEFVAKLKVFQADFVQQLQANDLEVFGVAGEEFNPNFHNALSMVPAPNPSMHNKLAFVSSQGYKLHDRVVVPADVMVFFDPTQS